MPIIISRNRNMRPEEVRSRADLDELSSDNLRIWILARRETRNLTRLYLQQLLNLARRIWDNLELTNKVVRSRADLDRMSTDGLRRWIQSQGLGEVYQQGCETSSTARSSSVVVGQPRYRP
jgi:hypothetical protein